MSTKVFTLQNYNKKCRNANKSTKSSLLSYFFSIEPHKQEHAEIYYISKVLRIQSKP